MHRWPMWQVYWKLLLPGYKFCSFTFWMENPNVIMKKLTLQLMSNKSFKCKLIEQCSSKCQQCVMECQQRSRATNQIGKKLEQNERKWRMQHLCAIICDMEYPYCCTSKWTMSVCFLCRFTFLECYTSCAATWKLHSASYISIKYVHIHILIHIHVFIN